MILVKWKCCLKYLSVFCCFNIAYHMLAQKPSQFCELCWTNLSSFLPLHFSKTAAGLNMDLLILDGIQRGGRAVNYRSTLYDVRKVQKTINLIDKIGFRNNKKKMQWPFNITVSICIWEQVNINCKIQRNFLFIKMCWCKLNR